MILIQSIASFVQCLALVAALHPLHVSVTDIAYDEKDKALEIMMRVFMDDLELTMRNRHQKPALDILNPKELTLDQMMDDYLKEKLIIALDGKRQEINYLGHERDGEAFVFYVEVSPVKKWKQIQVQNTIVTETYEDQSNLVHVTVRGKIRSLRLTKNNPSGKLSFDLK